MMYTASVLTATQATTAGFKTVTQVQNGGVPIIFNTTAAPFNDVVARQAIAYAINRKALNQVLTDGKGALAETIFAPGSPFYNAALHQLSPNAKKAQSLFNQLAAEGKPLSFTLSTVATFQSAAEAIQAQLASFQNVTVKLAILSNAAFTAAITPGVLNYQAGMSSLGIGADPEPQLRNALHTNGTGNREGYSNPAVDAALEAGASTTDMAKRVADYATVQKLFVRDVPMIFYGRNSFFFVYNKKVHGVSYSGTFLLRLDQVRVPK
jgi:peptide/nickel transport system substrate-binding protein